MFLSLQNSYVETLTSNVMILGDGGLERWLDHEGVALMNVTSGLKKEAPENSFSFCQGQSKKMAIYEPESWQFIDAEYVATLILDFPASRPVRNKFLMFIKCLFYDGLLQQPDLTRIII